MRGTGAALLVAAVLGRGPGPDAPLQEPVRLDVLRDEAREAMRRSCGRCHDRAQRSALPRALRLFDLGDADWSAHLTDEQLDGVAGRFEPFGMPPPDRVIVQRYLDAERARRAALASGAVH